MKKWVVTVIQQCWFQVEVDAHSGMQAEDIALQNIDDEEPWKSEIVTVRADEQV